VGGAGEVGLDLYLKDATYKIMSNELIMILGGGEKHSYLMHNNPYHDEDAVFVQAVKSGKGNAIKSTYADSLKTLKVTLAANQSAKTGKVIKL
jgi:predicted dehydrogenase